MAWAQQTADGKTVETGENPWGKLTTTGKQTRLEVFHKVNILSKEV